MSPEASTLRPCDLVPSREQPPLRFPLTVVPQAMSCLDEHPPKHAPTREVCFADRPPETSHRSELRVQALLSLPWIVDMMRGAFSIHTLMVTSTWSAVLPTPIKTRVFGTSPIKCMVLLQIAPANVPSRVGWS